MYAENYAQVGANIQRVLESKSMTQQQLADALSISKQVMHKIIKGLKAINVNELAKIAQVLGTTADVLLTVQADDVSVDNMAFMGNIQDEQTKEKVELLRDAIDEILLLEELINE